METHIKAWHEWSQVMGLKENHAKTCAVGRGKTKVSLKENHLEWAAEEIKILGLCTIYKPRANTKQENDRLTAAKNTATLLQTANLGWIQGLKAHTLSNLRLLTAGAVGIHPKKMLMLCSTSWVSLGANRAASKNLRRVWYGATTELALAPVIHRWCRIKRLRDMLEWKRSPNTSLQRLRKNLHDLDFTDGTGKPDSIKFLR